MKLIKCNRCGRPYYDDQAVCPFCGQDTKFSANNFITKPITSPESHRKMEMHFSGEELKAAPAPAEAPEAPVVVETPQEAPATAEPIEAPQEAPAMTQPEVDEDADTSERAEAMASITAPVEAVEEESADEEPQVEIAKPRKRHGWIWIIVILLILAAAAAVYWKWDFVYEKVTSLLG